MFKNFLLFMFVILVLCTPEAKAEVCKYWLSEVDANTEVSFEIDKDNSNNILKGINCLLKLQGNRADGLFSGATNNRVSQIFPKASIEVCALYYISYLFYGDWEHANAIALVGEDKKPNSPKTVKTAFASYRKWFKTVQKIGLEEARKQKLDPLADSGVSWY